MLFAIAGFLFAVVVRAADPGPATPLPSERLHNLHRVTPELLLGSVPDSDAAFAELATLGVKVVVSVDGALPDVAAARRHGLRYVHLPFGYDGLPTNRVAELTLAMRTAGGPVYVHCHHGRHRGPAAAAVICATFAGWSTNRTLALLEQAGTGHEYPGLYRSVAAARPPAPAALAAVGPLPEVARTSSVVDAMVAVDTHLDRLKLARKSGFREVPGQPDASPAHEATLLWEQFRELARLPNSAGRGSDYRRQLTEAEREALALRTLLADPASAVPSRERAAEAVIARCASCHKAHRNGGAAPR